VQMAPKRLDIFVIHKSIVHQSEQSIQVCDVVEARTIP
jgi:hypothetical protein